MDKILYHGSNNPNLEELKPHVSTHQKNCIYATPSRAAALLFMGKGHGDLDTCIFTRDGELQIVERREGVFEDLFNKEGYLYEIDGSTFKHYDYLWSLEEISFEESIKPLKKIRINNIMSAIEEEERLGNVVVYKYPNRPENIPLDNSDLIEKYIGFEKKGLIGAVGDLLEIYPEFAEKVNEIYPEYFKEGKEKSK